MTVEPGPELFREVFGRFATGVAVVTAAASQASGGMTANALCSLSLDPLLALVCFESFGAWGFLMAAYALSVCFAIVALGEHYVVDVMVGTSANTTLAATLDVR